MNEFYATEEDMGKVGTIPIAMNFKNKLLTIVNAILTILGGYRMASLIVAPTWWEQLLWTTVIIISGGYSIYYFYERRR